MSRTTHDINLDHHGTLDSSRVVGGSLASSTLGSVVGQYYADQPLFTVIQSLDERLTAIARGYNIVPARFTCDAFVRPYFRADAVISA